MAEEKKDVKKEGKKDEKKKGTTWEDVVLLILGLVTIFFVIIPQLMPESANTQTDKGIAGVYNNVFGEGKTETVIDADGRTVEVSSGPSAIEEVKFRLSDVLSGTLIFIAILSIFLSALFGILWYFNSFKLGLIRSAYEKSLGIQEGALEEKDIEKMPIPAGYVPDTNDLRNPKWELVEKYYNSGNPSDWRIAIIEADILLFEVLQASGFPGDTIGEMLKAANPAQLQSLQIAWKSHLIRNKLAHEGASLQLTRNMVEEAIEGFRTVFTELNYI